MSYFLAKTEPGTYSIDDLERDKRTAWDGVTNPQAVRAIREMKPGDIVFIYHSGGVSRAVGVAEIKQSKKFDDWALVRQGRLSTMAVPEKFVTWMLARYPKAKI